MNLKINWEKVAKYLKIAVLGLSVGVAVYAGSILVSDANEKARRDKFPQIKRRIFLDEKNGVKKIVTLKVNGVTYSVPPEFTIEEINGHIYGVRRSYIVSEPEKITLDDGTETYYIHNEAVIVDGLAYREVVELIEPAKIYDEEELSVETEEIDSEGKQKILKNDFDV
jgi:hypothetical protein